MGDAEAPENLDPTLNMQVERVIDEAFVSGYRVVMLVATALVSAISAARLIKGKKPKWDAEEAQADRGKTAPA